MKGCAGDAFQRGVGEGLSVGVAVDAGKQGAMDGVAEFGAVDKEADGFAVDLGRCCAIGVAGEAVLVLEFLRGGGVCGPEDKR